MNTKPDRSAAVMLGALLLAAFGSLALAACVVAAGHGLVLAFLAYVAAGATLTLAVAGGRMLVDVASARSANRPRNGRAARTA